MNCLPAYIDSELWDAYCEMRCTMPKAIPFTDYAKKLIVMELMKFHDAGYDANNSLQQAVMKGWRGVFKGELRSDTKKQISPELARIKEYSEKQVKAGPPPEIKAQIDAILRKRQSA